MYFFPIVHTPFNSPRFASRLPGRIKPTSETITRVYEYPLANDFAQRPIGGLAADKTLPLHGCSRFRGSRHCRRIIVAMASLQLSERYNAADNPFRATRNNCPVSGFFFLPISRIPPPPIPPLFSRVTLLVARRAIFREYVLRVRSSAKRTRYRRCKRSRSIRNQFVEHVVRDPNGISAREEFARSDPSAGLKRDTRITNSEDTG